MLTRLLPGLTGLLAAVSTLSMTALVSAAEPMFVLVAPDAKPRVLFAAERLTGELKKLSISAEIGAWGGNALPNAAVPQQLKIDLAKFDRKLEIISAPAGKSIRLYRAGDPSAPKANLPTAKEGFAISTADDGSITIVGKDDTGILYGALELQQRIADAKGLPDKFQVADAPQMIMRGAVIGMQKTYILPGRKVYEYPYTPESFPFFYDKAFWNEYLDFLLKNRFDTLFLWNGCPFASLVKVEGFEYAQEVPDDVFAKNQEMFRYIATECDKRGIWLVQQFYSILIPKPIAEKYNVDTQLKGPTDFAADYHRKAVAQFIKEYPEVGLMPCLGEALQGIDNQKYWLNDVTLAGVKDGMKLAGLTEEPPVVIRTHATDLRQILPDTLKIYKNIYTEAKFNGESLTTWEPRGKRQIVHQAMGKLGAQHLINVHILANLEPFRYGAQRFIQKCVQAGRDRLGAVGLHLYPLDYWSFPETPDNPPLKNIDRDWNWYAAWARYAWNPDIPEAEDHAWWIEQYEDRFGSKEAAEKILSALNDSGECAPRILRRYGITEGNRQTMSLGMTLDELVNPKKYREFEELWESQAPPGERLSEYVEREFTKKPHEGETPVSINAEVRKFAAASTEAIDAAGPAVTKNTEEFARIQSDIHAIRLMSESYCEKTDAAVLALRYRLSQDIKDLEAARPHLAKSLELYKQLAELTSNTYRFANTMQTSQRRIPISGGDEKNQPANYHWTQLVPLYEKELADFDQQLADIRSGKIAPDSTIDPLKPAIVANVTGGEIFTVKAGEKVFTDQAFAIDKVAAELKGLPAIRFSHTQAAANTLPAIEFESKDAVTVLVGFIRQDKPEWRKVPDLETDASAVDQYTSEPVIQNAVSIRGLPPIDVYGVKFPAGKQTLSLRGQGSFVVLGIVPQTTQLPKRNAKLGVNP